MERETQEFIAVFREFLDEVVSENRAKPAVLTALGEIVQHHLEADVTVLPIVTETIAQHRLVDADIALEILRADSGRLVGASGGSMRFQEGFGQLLNSPHFGFDVGPVDYYSAPSGPDSIRQVVGFGVHLLTFEGEAVAVLQRAARPEYGQETASVDVLSRTPEVSTRVLGRLRELMLTHSVLRGQVLSFTGDEFRHSSAGVTFLPRPSVREDEVVLGPGVLDSIAGHVVEIGRLRDRLRDSGQHLKRGVLLYGPPGTGKTLTVRHLLSRSEGVTCVVLAGNSIRFITAAAELARAMQPALVVLEDVDLIAAERGMFDGPQPLLFAVLDVLDGLDGDADVAFVLTTNRADILEPALAQRPGRVDLAVEIPLPAKKERRRLFALYADGLGLSDGAIRDAANRAKGVTGSFAKELMRRTVLRAAQEDRPPVDSDLAIALDELLSTGARLTRSLLGVGGTREQDDSDD